MLAGSPALPFAGQITVLAPFTMLRLPPDRFRRAYGSPHLSGDLSPLGVNASVGCAPSATRPYRSASMRTNEPELNSD